MQQTSLRMQSSRGARQCHLLIFCSAIVFLIIGKENANAFSMNNARSVIRTSRSSSTTPLIMRRSPDDSKDKISISARIISKRQRVRKAVQKIFVTAAFSASLWLKGSSQPAIASTTEVEEELSQVEAGKTQEISKSKAPKALIAAGATMLALKVVTSSKKSSDDDDGIEKLQRSFSATSDERTDPAARREALEARKIAAEQKLARQIKAENREKAAAEAEKERVRDEAAAQAEKDAQIRIQAEQEEASRIRAEKEALAALEKKKAKEAEEKAEKEAAKAKADEEARIKAEKEEEERKLAKEKKAAEEASRKRELQKEEAEAFRLEQAKKKEAEARAKLEADALTEKEKMHAEKEESDKVAEAEKKAEEEIVKAKTAEEARAEEAAAKAKAEEEARAEVEKEEAERQANEVAEANDTKLTVEEMSSDKKFSSIEDPGERAYEILLDLGMISVSPDPSDPNYDNSNDDEYVS